MKAIYTLFPSIINTYKCLHAPLRYISEYWKANLDEKIILQHVVFKMCNFTYH